MANRSSTPGLRQWLAATMFACVMIAATTGHSWHPISSKLEFIGAYPVYPEVDYGSGPQAEAVRRGEYLLLGATFLLLQGSEYFNAYTKDGLTLNAGVYGSTFFILTGFHGLHLSVGTIILLVILGRSIAAHFTPANHFAFQGVTWYWHFVDVVWLLLFVFVYWL